MVWFARSLFFGLVVTGLGACSSALRWTPDTYVVQPGDTVYSIAFQYDIDKRDLMAWNRLDGNALIFVGQRLRLYEPEGYYPPPATRSSSRSSSNSSRPPPAAKGGGRVGWQWPTSGPVITRFGATNKTRSGMHIGGKLGQPVKAAAAGKVVYAGDSLPGYGQLLIIKHNSQYLSAYGHNQQLLVGEGDQVSLGQSIAKMGEGPGNRPLLHFEIRRSGRPVDPLIYLPRR